MSNRVGVPEGARVGPWIPRQILHLLVEPLPREAELTGGLGAAPAVAIEGAAREPGLHPAQRVAEALARARRLRALWDRAQRGADPIRDVSGTQVLAGLGQGQRALDLVLELAHVARPLVDLEQTQRLGIQVAAALARTPIDAREEVPGPREGGRAGCRGAAGRDA